MISKLLPLIPTLKLSFFPKSSFAQIKRRKYSSSAPIYEVKDAIKFAQVHAVANFNETIDISIMFFILKFFLSLKKIYSLNVDPKRGDQLVRGSCVMPSGLGKKIIVAVHCEPNLHEKVKAAGADIIVNSEIKNQVTTIKNSRKDILIIKAFKSTFRLKRQLSTSIS